MDKHALHITFVSLLSSSAEVQEHKKAGKKERKFDQHVRKHSMHLSETTEKSDYSCRPLMELEEST